MSSFASRTPRWVISTTAALSCFCGAVVAQTEYFYADTDAFSDLTTGVPIAFALSAGSTQFNTLTITRPASLSPDMSESDPQLTFSATDPVNPDRVAGSRKFFQVGLDTTTGSAGEASYELSFATPLPISSYLVFVEFQLQKKIVKAKAFDASDTLIPFGSITFSKQNGQDPNGTTAPGTFTEEDGYTGVLSTDSNSNLGNPVMSLSSSVPIKRLVLDWDLNPNDSTSIMNSARFNVAVVPEPSTYAMALAGLACGGYSMSRRRKRA
jgi:hypothetical protein